MSDSTLLGIPKGEAVGTPIGMSEGTSLKEPSYFFRLSAFQDKLLDYYAAKPHFIAPEDRKNEVLGFVSGGLRDLSTSEQSSSSTRLC